MAHIKEYSTSHVGRHIGHRVHATACVLSCLQGSDASQCVGSGSSTIALFSPVTAGRAQPVPLLPPLLPARVLRPLLELGARADQLCLRLFLQHPGGWLEWAVHWLLALSHPGRGTSVAGRCRAAAACMQSATSWYNTTRAAAAPAFLCAAANRGHRPGQRHHRAGRCGSCMNL